MEVSEPITGLKVKVRVSFRMYLFFVATLFTNVSFLKQNFTSLYIVEKLKLKLKILAERQQQGKDIGVPVLTRWLGDDIPVWAGEGVNVEEWKQKVDDKYKQMRRDEVEWQKQIIKLLDREKSTG
jgi:hypothetical protein